MHRVGSVERHMRMRRLVQTEGLSEDQRGILGVIREFVDREILPVASELEHRDEYPTAIVDGLKESVSSG